MTGLTFPLPFIIAAHFTPAHRASVDLIVLHSMESAEKPGTARGTALWFAGQAKDPAPLASAHFCVDADEAIQCVPELAVAWGAPGANANGLHIELAGKASQTPEEWRDEFSMPTLHRAIDLTVALCRRWSIPAKAIDALGLARGERGITTHAAVSTAFRKTDHTDPGPGFPLDWYAERVASILSEAA